MIDTEFVTKAVDYIGDLNCGNALKIREFIKIKDTDTGYDLQEFFQAFTKECVNRAYKSDDKATSKRYSKMVSVTLRSMRDCKSSGLSKSTIFDMWVFDIRELFTNV